MSFELTMNPSVNGAGLVRPEVFQGACPLPISNYKNIVLAHGSGGRLSHQLIQQIILPSFRNDSDINVNFDW